MKSKLLKPLIITAVVIAILVGGYYLLNKTAPEPQASPTPTPAAKIIDNSTRELDRVRIEPVGSKPYEITVTKSDLLVTNNVVPARKGFGYLTSSLSEITGYMTSLNAQAVIKDSATPQELTGYGFDSPTGKQTGTFKDGGKTVLIIGGQTLDKSGYYVKLEDSAKVYTIGAATAQSMLTPEPKLRTLNFFPPNTDQQDPNQNVQKMKLTNPDGSFISLRRYSDDEIKKLGNSSSVFEMSLPEVYQTNDTIVSEKYISVATGIVMSDVVEDDPKDLSKYGLDKPYRLELTATDGKQYVVLIGSTNPDGDRYIMQDGINSVLLSSKDHFTFMDIGKLDLMSRLAWIYNIDQVSRIDYDLAGVKHTLDIDSNMDAKTFSAKLDGGDVNETVIGPAME
jgi:hypothetical protein